jgi:hypothetical protein
MRRWQIEGTSDGARFRKLVTSRDGGDHDAKTARTFSRHLRFPSEYSSKPASPTFVRNEIHYDTSISTTLNIIIN